MSDPYVGEIRLFAGNFAPFGWAWCDGSLFSCVEFSSLFHLVGTTYGGDGLATFGVPDLRGRVPIHQGAGHAMAEAGGAETVTLTTPQLATHSHPLAATTNLGTRSSPLDGVLAQTPSVKLYRTTTTPTAPLAPNSVEAVGGSKPHPNVQPVLPLGFIIALNGVFPTRD